MPGGEKGHTNLKKPAAADLFKCERPFVTTWHLRVK